MAQCQPTAGERIFNLAALAVFCSILLHGLTDTPGANWISRAKTHEPRGLLVPRRHPRERVEA